MNIFTQKKKLLAIIDDLNAQLEVKSSEVFRLRGIILNKETELKKMHDLFKKYDKEDIEMTIQLGKSQQELEEAKKAIADLKETNNGLASSVNELKGKLKAKEKRISELKSRLESLKSKALKP